FKNLYDSLYLPTTAPSLFFSSYGSPRGLHSFPTRRSSDLDVARQIHHEDPVGRGFERRVEQGQCLPQIPLRTLPLGDVAVGHDDRADGRVVQAVHADRLEAAPAPVLVQGAQLRLDEVAGSLHEL